MAGQYNVPLPSPKPHKGKETVTKVGKNSTFISREPYYESKEGKAALEQIKKTITKSTSEKLKK